MRRHHTVLVFMLLCLGCAARPRADLDADGLGHLDDDNGFGDVQLETPLAEVLGVEFVEEQDGTRCYRRPADVLDLGGAPLTAIRYCFVEDRLARIILTGVGVVTARAALTRLQQQYGAGTVLAIRQAGEMRRVGRVWNGSRAAALFLYIAGAEREVTIAFLSQALLAAQQRHWADVVGLLVPSAPGSERPKSDTRNPQ